MPVPHVSTPPSLAQGLLTSATSPKSLHSAYTKPNELLIKVGNCKLEIWTFRYNGSVRLVPGEYGQEIVKHPQREIEYIDVSSYEL